ncbi:MAG: DnaA regulatory inactivator Hda [Steroidobacteraceae bacterium]
MRQLPLGIRIADRAVFATFLPGRDAQAVQYLKALAEGRTGGTAWICGPLGAGKSHLLQAACVLASEHLRAGYLPLRELASFGSRTIEGLGELDCLCLDDIDSVTAEPGWARALFALHREIEERGGTLVASARRPPALASWALSDLGSRWTASAVFQLKGLEDAEVLDALKLHAGARGIELPEGTARWLQRRFPRDMRSLYDLLDALDQEALIERRRLTVPFIRSVLARRS